MTPRRRTITDAERVLDEAIAYWQQQASDLRARLTTCETRREVLEAVRRKLDEPIDDGDDNETPESES